MYSNKALNENKKLLNPRISGFTPAPPKTDIPEITLPDPQLCRQIRKIIKKL
jgi:hypothetical protein